MKHRIHALFIVCATLLLPVRAFAFKVKGHEAIEGLAYNRMLSSAPHAMCGDPNHVVSGKEVLRYLIAIGVLEAPRCFAVRPDSIDARTCESPSAETDRWPVLGSGRPDDLWARQLGAEGQCFHFMARPQDVYDTNDDPRAGLPKGLTVDAPRRCIEAINTLWQELLSAPEGARTVDRGIYALMHAVEDSYSSAHVERDAEGRILYLKPWDVVSLPYLVHWSGFTYFKTQRQHSFGEERDDAWRSGIASAEVCPEAATPLELAQHSECFSPRAIEASQAVEDLLNVTYCAFRSSNVPKLWSSRGPKAALTPVALENWRTFLNAHFANANNEPIEHDKVLDESERERTADLLIGGRVRSRWTNLPFTDGGVGDLALAVHGFPLLRDTYPFVPFLAVEPGLRIVGKEDRNAGFTIDAGALVPLTNKTAIGFTPMGFESYWSIERKGYPDTLLSAALRLDFFLFKSFWINLTPPRFDWLHGRFVPELSAAFGYAWDPKPEVVGVTPGYRDDGRDWSPHRVTPRPAPIPVNVSFTFGPQVAPSSGYGIRVVMPEIMARAGGWWQRLEYGGAFLAQSERRDQLVTVDGNTSMQELVTTSAGVAVRFRFWAVKNFFALGITPAQVDLGDASGLQHLYWDVQGTAQATVRVGAFQVVLDSPAVRWYDERPDEWRPKRELVREMFLRFGWNQTL